MLSIGIDRVTARYRLPASALREQPRVQRIVNEALTHVLEGAIERNGIGSNGYVCIRDVHAVATVRLREPDSALANGVGDAIAIAIQRLIDEASPSVVQYGSRAHALVDLASSATAGDFSRDWAWTQVGIWRADFPLRADRTAELIVRALAKEPTHAVAVAAHVARQQADRFIELIARATPDAWSALARAAIAAAGGAPLRPPHVTGAVDGGQETADWDGRESPTSTFESVVRRVVMHSAIARVAIDASIPGEIRGALAALSLLEVEPSAVRGGDIVQRLMAIERAIGLAARDTVRLAAARYREIQDEPSMIDRRRSTHAAADGDGRRAVDGDNLLAADGERSIAGDAPARHPRPTDRGTDVRASGATDRTADVVPDVRRSTRTGHGGLLYLVNLLPRIGVVETLLGDERWSDRGLRWVLHQLAMALVAIAPDDPAALVFAGLAPGSPPPSSLQEPPTDPETAAVDTLRAIVTRALCDAYRGLPEADAESDQRLVNEVCRRPAQIAAEPGWIEARFALEDVDLDIRRSGLDRDPDWVPWLGIVLRFVYV